MVKRGSSLRAQIGARKLALGFALVGCLGERPSLPGDGLGGEGGSSSSLAGTGGNDTQAPGGGGSAGAGGDGGPDAGAAGASGTATDLVPTQLGFQAISNAYAGSPLPVVVSIQAADGTVVPDAPETVITLALGSNPGGANLIGYATATARSGVATFDSVGLDQLGSGYTLTATAKGLSSGTSPAFDVARLPFERVATGLYGGIVSHIAISNEGSPTLYATGPAGVFRSENNGGSWAASNFGNPTAIGLIAIDPQNPARLYTTPSFGSGSFSGSGFYVTASDDGGDAWRPLEGMLSSGLSTAQIGTFAIDPQNSDILYAGNFAGIFRSSDAGATWEQTAFPYANYALAIDPIAPTILYAAAYDQANFMAMGIYKTVDRGDNWAPVNNPVLPANFSATGALDITVTPTGVFVDQYRSTDGGASWQINAGDVQCWVAAYAPTDVQRVYCGRGSSVRVSTNGGQTFGAEVSTGGVRINSLAVDPNDANRVYAATDDGLFVSANGGQTWASSSTGISALALGGADMHPEDPDIVYVGGPTGVYRTTNGGITWALSDLGDSVTAVKVDSTGAVYACTLGATFYRSVDGGVTWAGTTTGAGPYCYNIAVSGSTIWLPTVGGGIMRSQTGGDSFTATPLVAPSYAVEASADGATVYAATNEGTFRSVDGGDNWTPMTNDLANALVVDRNNPLNVYMGLSCASAGELSSSGGTRRSRDGGDTWEAVVPGGCIEALRQLADGRLLAVSRSYPEFALSINEGVSWAPGGLGLAGEPGAIAASADGQTLYVPTTLGLYKSLTGGF